MKEILATHTYIFSPTNLFYAICILILLLFIFMLFILYARKKQLKIQHQQKELSIAMEAGKVSMWSYDVKKKIFKTSYNHPTCKEGMSEKTFKKNICPLDIPKHHQLFNDLLSGKIEKGEQKIRYLTKDGEYRWYQAHAIIIRNPLDNRVQYIIGTERDISEEVRHKMELDESKSKLKMALKVSHMFPWIYEVESGYYSSAQKDISPFKDTTQEELLAVTNKEDVPLFRKGMENLLNGEQETLNITIRLQFPGEKQAWYNIYGAVMDRNEEGYPTRVIGVSRDITDHKIMEELISLQKKADEATLLKNAFLANIGHEIRTPLNAIIGFSRLIMDADNNEEKTHYINIVEKNNELLLQLINDIIDLSKIETDQLEFQEEQININSLLIQLFEKFKDKKDKKVNLTYHLPQSLCLITTDRYRLKQILSNLLSNACKFTEAGGIQFGYKSIPEGIYFYVKDTGKGIQEEDMVKVFQRFSKLDLFEQGTGLGLSICKSIVEHLGGKIGINSELGKGSEFWFTLPCQPEAPASSEHDSKVMTTINQASLETIGEYPGFQYQREQLPG